jgi:fatty-acyl-CoA synthase
MRRRGSPPWKNCCSNTVSLSSGADRRGRPSCTPPTRLPRSPACSQPAPPKFVLHDQATIAGHAHDVARGFGYTASDARILITAPLCGVFGFCNAMAAFAAARPLVMYPTFDAHESANAIRRHRVTHTNCTDDMIAQMLAAVPETPAFPGAHFFGYAAFSPAQADLPLRADARGLKVVGLYGSSELQALLARQAHSLPVAQRMPGGGKPVSDKLRVRARDPETQIIQPHGTSGELEFFAPSAMVGYFENEEATAEAFTGDGWFKSGDFGHTTEDGGFVFVARLGDAMRLSGFLVSPVEIEDVLQAHPGVAAAQVVGADTGDGVRPVAFVIPKPGTAFDEAALIAHCKSQIAGFKVPARIVALDAFPVTPGANATKIQKSKLREIAQALFAG